MVFKALNDRDFTEVQPFLSEELVIHFPGVGEIPGLRKCVIFLKTLLRKYTELKFTVTEIIFENERAVVVWTNKGIKINGEEYVNSGITLFYFSDNKISFISDYFKDTSFTSER